MIFNEIKCHVNTSLGLVGGCIPPCVRACTQCLRDPHKPSICFHNQGACSWLALSNCGGPSTGNHYLCV